MKKEKIILICAAAVCVLSLIVMSAVLLIQSHQESSFTPPAFESSAVSGSLELPEDVTCTPVQVSDGYEFSICGQPVLEEDRLMIYFTSQKDNTVWLRLRICASDGTILGESGVLRPGESLPSVPLNQECATGQEITIKVMGYTPDTWHSAGVAELNTKLQEKENTP